MKKEFKRLLDEASNTFDDRDPWDYTLKMEFRDDCGGLTWEQYFKYNWICYFPEYLIDHLNEEDLENFSNYIFKRIH